MITINFLLLNEIASKLTVEIFQDSDVCQLVNFEHDFRDLIYIVNGKFLGTYLKNDFIKLLCIDNFKIEILNNDECIELNNDELKYIEMRLKNSYLG